MTTLNKTATKQLTPKERDFAFAYIETGSAAKAYRQTYDHNGNDATARRCGHAVLHRLKVAALVTDLQAEHRARHNVTVDRLTEELEIARQLALQNKSASAAVSATMGKARLHGLLVDKQEQIQRPNVSFQMILPQGEGDEA